MWWCRGSLRHDVYLLYCICGVGLCASPSACFGSRGQLLGGARAAALGGVGVVGVGSSPLRIAAPITEGLILEVSWANPYGISGLELGSLSVRQSWRSVSSAASIQVLETPTPYSELQLAGNASIEAANGIVLGAGAALASLRDGAGSFAQEWSAAFGAALTGFSGLELGCVVETPLGQEPPAGMAAASSAGGSFRWGFSLPAARGVSFLVEEERAGGWISRKLGGEVAWLDVIRLRAGVSDSPFTLSFGIGIWKGRTALDLAAVEHETLGLTPHGSISYSSAAGKISAK